MDEKNENTLIKCKKDFIYNAIEDGWTVTKKNNYYVFKKKHEEKKEVYLDSYLTQFIEKNIKSKS